MQWRRLWLCLPPAVFAFGDYFVTVRGQPLEYWAGDYERANETNPLVHWLMTEMAAEFCASLAGRFAT